MNIKNINILIILVIILIFTSCKNNADLEKAIEIFFIFVIQVISFVLFGIAGIVLSIVSSNSKTNTTKIIGGILIGIFTIVSIICLLITLDINPKKNYIYFVFLIDFIIISISIFFLAKNKYTGNKLTHNSNEDYLEQIIESNTDKEINDIDSL